MSGKSMFYMQTRTSPFPGSMPWWRTLESARAIPTTLKTDREVKIWESTLFLTLFLNSILFPETHPILVSILTQGTDTKNTCKINNRTTSFPPSPTFNTAR